MLASSGREIITKYFKIFQKRYCTYCALGYRVDTRYCVYLVESMRCPYCLNTKLKVVDKRDVEELGYIRRRRECLGCSKRFTTYERIELTGFSIVKKDGRRENFDRQKLIRGISKACEKRPIPRQNIEKLVAAIEGDLRNSEQKEIPADEIGKLVMARLRELDKVAYIRFASVYREFTDISSFESELKDLKKDL